MRLIDANTLLDEIHSLQIFITGMRSGKYTFFKCLEEYKKSIIRIIDEQSTIDTVDAVTCEDCISHDNCEVEELFKLFGLSSNESYCCIAIRSVDNDRN